VFSRFFADADFCSTLPIEKTDVSLLINLEKLSQKDLLSICLQPDFAQSAFTESFLNLVRGRTTYAVRTHDRYALLAMNGHIYWMTQSTAMICYCGSSWLGSNEVTTWKVRKHASERFPRFIFLCDMLKSAITVILALFDFAKVVSSGHADPTLQLVWGGWSWPDVMVCPKFFCFRHIWNLNYPLFIKNFMILEYKVNWLVLKLLNETYIFSIVFLINFSWRKVYFLFLKPDLAHPAEALTWQKLSDSIPGYFHCSVPAMKWKYCHGQYCSN